jgi:PRC-barrel domain protein
MTPSRKAIYSVTSLVTLTLVTHKSIAQAATVNETTSPTFMRASTLVGTRVKTPQGEEVGEVSDIILHEYTGCILYTVVLLKGGEAKKKVAVPWAAYSSSFSPNILVLRITEETLYNAPSFEYARLKEYGENPVWIFNLYSYYGLPLPDGTTGYTTSGTTTTTTTGVTASTSATPYPTPYSTVPVPTVPEFPCPPPVASAFDVIPNELLVRNGERPKLKDIATRLDSALQTAGFAERSYYSACDGFAMASRIQEMKEDGSLVVHSGASVPNTAKFMVSNYLRALAFGNAPPGHYRVVVFVVTSVPFAQKPVTKSEDWEWRDKGLNKLPTTIGNRDFLEEYSCTALIYEFRKIPAGEPNVDFVRFSAMLGRAHLEKSGLLIALAKTLALQ